MTRTAERKKQKQRRRAEKRSVEKAKYLAARQRASRYPDIKFDTTEGNKEFVQLVKEAVGALDFDSPEMGPEWMRQFYRDLRKHGGLSADLQLRQRAVEQQQSPSYASLPLPIPTKFGWISSSPAFDDPRIDPDALGVHLGDRIFKKIDRKVLAQYLPQNDFTVVFYKDELLIRFSSLLQEQGKDGTIYYSRLKPTITIDGKPLIVAFSKHAIERVQTRRIPTGLNYGSTGDLHTYLAKCIYHERKTLPTGQPAFCIYDACEIPGYRVYRNYFEKVFGGSDKKVLGAGACHYRLGYFPVAVEGDFAKAKTMLFPGFRATPERRLIESKLKYEVLLDEVEEGTVPAENFYEGPQCIEIIKWLHDNGFPQVIQIKQRTTVPN